MFVFIGGVGPSEASPKDVLDQPCPACGSLSLQEKRVDQVTHNGCMACKRDSRAVGATQQISQQQC
jgi:hypothetical protein